MNKIINITITYPYNVDIEKNQPCTKHTNQILKRTNVYFKINEYITKTEMLA